ncbi:DUF2285 domain-containing protein [Gluconacetobacter asukensis]|uniref:DUF2285 domain-containing protein n=1 Tax=Gluconacetobacter asukensis TaxID=1017181 RepID=UPI002156D55C|nr:hypothetical protein AA13595_0238 [Gluconacetobacter johannae DSM 13595]
MLPGVIALADLPAGLADPDHPPLASVFIGVSADQTGDVLIQRSGALLRLHVVAAGMDMPSVVLPFDALFEVRVQAALRLWRAMTGRRPGPNPATLSSERTRRLILALRALDGRAEGASYRDLACILPGGIDLSDRSWISHDARDRIKRLVQLGQGMVRGGYRRLLLHPYRGRV